MVDIKVVEDTDLCVAPCVFADVMDFHTVADVKTGITTESLKLRRKLIEEETAEIAESFGYIAPEWKEATSNEQLYLEGFATSPKLETDLVELADGCCDAIYVCMGTLIQLFGVDCAMDLWDEVHRSNMDKFPNGVITRDDNGKIKKPENWTPPNLEKILINYGVINNEEV